MAWSRLPTLLWHAPVPAGSSCPASGNTHTTIATKQYCPKLFQSHILLCVCVSACACLPVCSTSILENIRIGNPGASMSQVRLLAALFERPLGCLHCIRMSRLRCWLGP